MADDQTFTGVVRTRQTRLSVKVFDRVARVFITVGGIGTILAVTLIMVFLVWIVLPLFGGGSLSDEQVFASAALPEGIHPIRVTSDEYRAAVTIVLSDGSVLVQSARDGSLISLTRPLGEAPPTCWAFSPNGALAAFGYEDGTIRIGSIGFEAEFFDKEDLQDGSRGDDLPSGILEMEPGDAMPFDGGIVQVTPEGQYRLQKPIAAFEEPVSLTEGVAVVLIDITPQDEDSMLAALSADGTVNIKEVRRKPDFMTGLTKVTLTGTEMKIDPPAGRGLPAHLLLSGIGNDLYAVWSDGRLTRYNISDRENPVEAEGISLLPGVDLKVTTARWLIGKTTLLIGDSAGRVSTWFPTTPENAETVDGIQLVRAQILEGPRSAVTAIRPSMRSRMVAVGHADGRVRLHHVTTENLVTETVVEAGEAVLAVSVAPKEDALVAATTKGVWSARLAADHPDISLGVLFTKSWYEGYATPEHVWQSTGGTDDAEPKLGLMPLIFGTLKATIYSMLFGLPLALLGAVFASEFLHPKVKSKIKPTIEIMASLPSVVLGFLAGLVIAPFVEDIVPAVLASFLTIPFAFLLGAFLWQLLPHERAIAYTRFRFPVICVFVPVGLVFAMLLGPVLETVLFSGDIKLWLDGQIGSGVGGWVFLLLPVAAILTTLLFGRVLGPWWRTKGANWDRGRAARFDIARFGAGVVVTVLVAVLLAGLLSLIGLDPRGSMMGTYVQRNALIVGFVMGFAVIPIIFTIAEDALSAVPEHLRSASLGAGATPWQTATRIIIPTAMSGLFSAAMIGLGRAVGETMIVLMATGNTAVMDGNIFNGFRTLAANLAVELPEAVKDSTHYRTLFFAALVLFAMTFILNTVAETIRLRFRKKAFEL